MMSSESIKESTGELLMLLGEDVILEEMSSHPLILLRDQFQRLENEFPLRNVSEQSQFFSRLNQLYINLFAHYLNRYSSRMSSSLLTALFDTLRLHVHFNLTLYPALSDYYFDLSRTYLLADTTIAYLTDQKTMLADLNECFLRLFASMGSEAVKSKTKASYSICASHGTVPTFFQFTPSTDRLLQALIVYLNHSFLDRQVSNSCPAVLQWLVHLSKIHSYVPFFVKTHYPAAILSWLKSKRQEMPDVSIDTWLLVFTLLHHLARHKMGVKTLNKLGAIETLKLWKDQHRAELFPTTCNEHEKDILIVYYLVYSALLVPKELKKENIQKLQRVLDFILERTLRAFDSPELCCGSYNVCEYLHGLAKFIVNDTFLLYILTREEIFQLFSEKFLRFHRTCFATDLNTIICSLLYSIFWSISFHAEFTTKLKANEEFLRSVDQSSKSDSVDEHAVKMKRAAKGILFNLDLIQMDIEPISDADERSETKVMVSYAHKDRNFCKQLVEQLQERFAGEIWVDFNRLSPPYEDDWEEIAKAITQCDVILIIVTENYCSSKSCRREVIHADKRNKRMVPIYQGKDYKAEDWFEIRVGSATWVRFGEKKTDEEVMEILLQLIQSSSKSEPSQIHTIVSHSSITTASHQMSMLFTATPLVSDPPVPLPIDQWTKDDVQQWISLPSSTLELSSGPALLSYINLLSHPSAQSDEYEQRMGPRGITREQFANFISSFASVPYIAATNAEQWTPEQVQEWFRQHQLSNELYNRLQLTSGAQLITYSRLLVHSSTRLTEEYERLRHQIGQELFHLDEYARFVSALNQLLQISTPPIKEVSYSCTIL